jgi:hypothetical protein
MGMDAKSEQVHAIYHQLTVHSDKYGYPVKQLQFNSSTGLLQFGGTVLMVIELVTRISNHTHWESVTTTVMAPWLIDASSDQMAILRFMTLDSKSEIAQTIYQQLKHKRNQ